MIDMDGWLDDRRVLLVLGYGVAAGAWVYVAARVAPGLETGWIAFAVLTIMVGVAVRRWWVVLGVAGPLAGFVALELTSDFGQGDWPDFAVFSPPTLGYSILIATALLLGCAIGDGLTWVGETYRGRPDR
jgi:hypothetical protein